ncbi:WYL domain-containing protein [Bacillus sp. NEB1478]|uniref:helix-turn-helix transcriptional regulator n=1 Tax=Bacillus sp. NEB1478 TaxID=3073816 RepID=UPI002873859F|nr:WYL domain-containing protein [Bacillus sp. NEB1478]WNB93011.1 WYL domain-containing protein [Bacillus sp. NEB1478]
MGDISTKQRLLKILQIFQEETDSESELSINDLVKKLQQSFGDHYSVKPRAIKDDIEELRSMEFDILENDGKYGQKFYSLQDRLFEVHELRLLIDAVSSARFITKEETKKLIGKIKRLTSQSLAKKLQNQIYLDGMIKSENSKMRYYIDALHTAITERRVIRFQYGTYDTQKDFKLHRDGEYYFVKPYGVVWKNDYYYLIGEYKKYGEVRHYRIDRMRNVKLEDESFQPLQINLPERINQSFNMYSGEKAAITLQFTNDLINVMIDRFGLDADIRPMDEHNFIVKTQAAVSDGLVRWLLAWGDQAKVIHPQELIEKMKDESSKLYHNYHTASNNVQS